MQKLYKSRSDKVIDGVCGGIAQYYKMDAVLIRIIWVVATILLGAGFFGVVAYLIAMIIIPAEPKTSDPLQTDDENFKPGHDTAPLHQEEEETSLRDPFSGNKESKKKTTLFLGLLLVGVGFFLIMDRVLTIDIWYWFRSIQGYLWPVLLIILGFFLLTRRQS